MDEMFTMQPLRRARMPGSTAFVIATSPEEIGVEHGAHLAVLALLDGGEVAVAGSAGLSACCAGGTFWPATPVRMICARPSASFWSVLFICIFSAALACRASRQTTSSPRARSSCTSHGVMGPVSTPILASSPACPFTVRSICPGPWRTGRARACVLSRPRRRSPSASATHPKPTNRVIEPPPMVRTAERQRPDRGIMEDLCPRRDYPMSTHATRSRRRASGNRGGRRRPCPEPHVGP